jgi:hypothetical protein
MNALSKDHGIRPGILFKSKPISKFYHIKSGSVEEHVYTEKGKTEFISLRKDECILFLDIVYDPFTKSHYFRFLSNSKILVIPFVKGQTIKALKANFEIKSSKISDVDKQ